MELTVVLALSLEIQRRNQYAEDLTFDRTAPMQSATPD